MERINIYDYQNPRLFLLDSLNLRQKKEPDFSARAWARELGLGSHTLVIMLLNGKRSLRLKHVPAFAQSLRLPSSEQLYLQAIVQYESATTQEERQLYSVWLAELHPGGSFRTKELDQFLAISHWSFTAILMMTKLKGFGGSAQEISRRLKGEISPAKAEAALQRLIDLGLLVKEADGRLHATFERLTTRDDVADEGARKYHRAASEAASHAVAGLPLDQREFQSFTMAVRRDKVALAKEMIRRFRAQLSAAVSADSDGDDLFQVNLQLFQLTESQVRPARTEDEGVEWEKQTHKNGAIRV